MNRFSKFEKTSSFWKALTTSFQVNSKRRFFGKAKILVRTPQELFYEAKF